MGPLEPADDHPRDPRRLLNRRPEEAAFTQAAARAVADVRAFRDATPTGDTAARYYVQNKTTGERWSVQPVPEASPKS